MKVSAYNTVKIGSGKKLIHCLASCCFKFLNVKDEYRCSGICLIPVRQESHSKSKATLNCPARSCLGKKNGN